MLNLAAESLSYSFNCKTFTKVMEPLYKSYEITYFKRKCLVIKNNFREKEKLTLNLKV